jgi:hypothetical protein
MYFFSCQVQQIFEFRQFCLDGQQVMEILLNRIFIIRFSIICRPITWDLIIFLSLEKQNSETHYHAKKQSKNSKIHILWMEEFKSSIVMSKNLWFFFIFMYQIHYILFAWFICKEFLSEVPAVEWTSLPFVDLAEIYRVLILVMFINDVYYKQLDLIYPLHEDFMVLHGV